MGLSILTTYDLAWLDLIFDALRMPLELVRILCNKKNIILGRN